MEKQTIMRKLSYSLTLILIVVAAERLAGMSAEDAEIRRVRRHAGGYAHLYGNQDTHPL